MTWIIRFIIQFRFQCIQNMKEDERVKKKTAHDTRNRKRKVMNYYSLKLNFRGTHSSKFFRLLSIFAHDLKDGQQQCDWVDVIQAEFQSSIRLYTVIFTQKINQNMILRCEEENQQQKHQQLSTIFVKKPEPTEI